MKNKTIHKINLFFSFYLAVAMIISIFLVFPVNAITDSTYSENFDDDVLVGNPTASWYTYTESVSSAGTVRDNYNLSSPYSFRHYSSGVSSRWVDFTLNNQRTPEYVNFSFLTDTAHVQDYVYLFSDGDYIVGGIFNENDEAILDWDGNVRANFTSFNWINISIHFNWTDKTSSLNVNNGSGWTSELWVDFEQSDDGYIEKIRFSNTGFCDIWYDDLSLVFDMPVEINIEEPLNWSSCNDNNTDFNVQIWDNGTANPINSTISLYIWNGLNYILLDSWNNDSITTGGWHNGTFNDLCLNRTYMWNLTITTETTVEFGPYYFLVGCDNMSVTINDGDSWTEFNDVTLTVNNPSGEDVAFNNDPLGGDWLVYADADSYSWNFPCDGNGNHTVYARFHDDCGYYYCNDTIYINGSLPNMTLLYPVEDETYTSVEWADAHTALFSSADSSVSGGEINVSCEFYTFVSDFQFSYDWSSDDDYFLYSLDLEPYVWFDDTNYTIIFNITNCAGYQLITVNFTLGDPLTDLAKHISLKQISPERENFTQLLLLDEGVSFDIICTETDGIDYRYFLTDWDGYVLDEFFDYTYLDIASGWQSKNYFKNRFYSRNFYKTWIGIDNASNDTQWDDLYGYKSIQYVSFTPIDVLCYVFNNTDANNSGRFQIIGGDFLGENETVYGFYTGIYWGFGTFKIGDVIPFHSIGSTLFDRPGVYDNDWGDRFDAVYPGFGYLCALFVILFFSLMPLLITHTFPPLTIQMFFTEMGIVISYAMGIFPMWLLQIALIGLLLAIFYKILDWYRSRSGSQTFSDTPIVKETGTRVKDVKSIGGKVFSGIKSKLGGK
jgi:hypothetical protein